MCFGTSALLQRHGLHGWLRQRRQPLYVNVRYKIFSVACVVVPPEFFTAPGMQPPIYNIRTRRGKYAVIPDESRSVVASSNFNTPIRREQSHSGDKDSLPEILDHDNFQRFRLRLNIASPPNVSSVRVAASPTRPIPTSLSIPAARFSAAGRNNCSGTIESAVGLSNLALDRAGIGCHIVCSRLRDDPWASTNARNGPNRCSRW
jgi:hypothetical protein